ncbi:MAG: glycosyltransferase family 9 protein [Nitrospirae bacterium]|nr:glycosyltransferase family 9 protein [Nitrospirota bacterium]
MKIDTMRWLDDYIGSVLCFMLTIITKAYGILTLKEFRGRAPVVTRDVKSILFIKFFGMGSIILASPSIKAVKKKYPGATVFFMTFRSNEDICDILKIADYCVYIRKGNLINFAVDIARALIRLQRARIDLAFDLEFFSRFTVILLLLSGAKIRIGYFLRKVWRGNFLTYQIYFNHFKHITKGFAAVTSPLGIDEKEIGFPLIEINDGRAGAVREILSGKGVELRPGERIVCININSSELSIDRRWPKERFVELTEKLLERTDDLFLVFIGSESEREYVQSAFSLIRDKRQRAVNLSGLVSLRELALLLKHSEALITCDSGPLHLAAALHTPTISLFGPETPVRYGPLGSRNVVICKELYCSPCLNVYNAKRSMCGGDNRCMQLISSEEVYEKIVQTFPELFTSGEPASSL